MASMGRGGPQSTENAADAGIVEQAERTRVSKVTAALPEDLWNDFGHRASARGITRVEALRRAVWLYTVIDERIAAGAKVRIEYPDGTDESLLLSPY
jgi:hypothetical protein